MNQEQEITNIGLAAVGRLCKCIIDACRGNLTPDWDRDELNEAVKNYDLWEEIVRESYQPYRSEKLELFRKNHYKNIKGVVDGGIV